VASTGVPHDGQKRASGGRDDPHAAHAIPSGLPHAAQNRASAALSEPQEGHAATSRV
jgi:hypothetical protein